MEVQNLEVSQTNNAANGNEHKQSLTEAEIEAWLVSYLAELADIEPDEIDVALPFERYDLDSSAAVGLTGDLEEWLGFQLDATVLYDYPTIQALAQHLATAAKASS